MTATPLFTLFTDEPITAGDVVKDELWRAAYGSGAPSGELEAQWARINKLCETVCALVDELPAERQRTVVHKLSWYAKDWSPQPR